METPVDLARTSRAELAALIVAQRERIADLEREVVGLRAELATQQALIAQLTDQVGVLLARQTDADDGEGPASRPAFAAFPIFSIFRLTGSPFRRLAVSSSPRPLLDSSTPRLLDYLRPCRLAVLLTGRLPDFPTSSYN